MTLFPVALVILLAWGVLAVGGSPSWAGAPVAVFAVATGLIGLIEGRQRAQQSTGLRHKPVAVALCILSLAIGAQLVPLPPAIVEQFSPSHDLVDFERLLATADRRDTELVPVRSAESWRTLSIAPVRTWIGFVGVAALGLLVLGSTHILPLVGVVSLSRAIALIGLLVAFLGIYQTSTTGDGLYSLYVPMSPVHRSAPFINRNHQAGWLVMVMALTLGAFAGEAARGMRGVRPDWRSRILWFGGREASEAILLLFTSAIIAIGVLTSRSRSGATIVLVSFGILAVVAGLRQPSKMRRGLVAASVIIVAAIVLGTSAVAVLGRVGETSWGTLDGRIAVWSDSARALRDFWITGTGFNTYGVSMLHYQTVRDGYRYIEAHNDYLQIAVEGGLLVGIPVLVLAASVLLETRRRFVETADDTRTYWIRIGAVTGIAAIAAQSLVDFTLQMPGAAVMFATLIAVAIHYPRPRQSEAALPSARSAQ